MFKHLEDDSELELKISDDGTLVIHCPTCNKLWSSRFEEVLVTEVPYTGVFGGRREYRTEIHSITLPVEVVRKLSTQKYSEMLSQNSVRIANTAQRAFPELFR